MDSDLRQQLQTSLGNAYTVERELGGGGMSRVFLATESALARQIVLKVLPPDTIGSVSVERFRREIQLCAKLQHPHIVSILSAGHSEGLPYYTMPFVKGESLRARLARGGELSINETVHILRDVAAALAYAHSEGVVHRDVKPDNVILSGGVAVVTDFGVAKAVDLAVTDGGSARDSLTSLGVALGTPAYMAPEQATADPHVDHRADIYSFGCVAYELLAGSSPFAGRPMQQLLAAQVTVAPEPILQRRPTVPPALAALVMKCLEKRPGDRPQSADELITALDAVATPSGGMTPTGARLARVKRTPWIAISAGVLGFSAVAAVLVLRNAPVQTLTLGSTVPIAVTPELEMEPGISPDGKLVAYSASTPNGYRIFVRQIDGGRSVLLTGELDGDHRWPRWSPDGSRLTFAAKGAAYVVAALGGTPKRSAESPNGVIGTPVFTPDGKEITYADAKGIWAAPVEGGAAPRLIVGGSGLHSPSWSPDGGFVAYGHGTLPSLRNLGPSSVWISTANGGQGVRISDSTHVNVNPAWACDGNCLLFISDVGGARDVYQQAVASGRPRGAPTRLTTALSAFTLTVAANGSRLAYDVVHANSNIWVAPIAAEAATPMSSARPVTTDKQHVEGIALSHDGKWLAYDSDRSGNFDIYKVKVEGGDAIQLTTNAANDFTPSWSPDDRELAFHSNREGPRHIFVVSAEGTAEQRVTTGESEDWLPDWSPDGKQLVYFASERYSSGASTAIQPFLVSRTEKGWSVPRPLPGKTKSTQNLRWSPDGSLIAFVRKGAIGVVPPNGEMPRIAVEQSTLGGSAVRLNWDVHSSVVFASVSNGATFSFWAVPISGAAPRLILGDDAAHHISRADFATDGRRIFFSVAAWESDVWVLDLKH